MDDDLVTSTPDFVHKNVEKGFAGIVPIFKSRYATNATQNYEYRPVTTASFAIQYALSADADLEAAARQNPTAIESLIYWQKQASTSHFISVMLYILCCFLVFIFVYKIIPEHNLFVALVTTVLFLIHPIHTEVVDNIKCRDELFVMLFGMSSLLLLYKVVAENLQNKTKYIYIGLGIACLILSIFSKKSGFVFVALIPLVLYFFTQLKWKTILPLLVIFLIGGLIFSLTKKLVFEENSERELFFYENPLYVNGSWGNRIPMFFYTIMWYLKTFLWPATMSFYYGYNEIPLADFANPVVWMGMVVVIGLTALSFWRIKKKEMWSFGFLFFMLTIGGIANLIVIAPGIVADRFLFVPSFGLAFLVSYYAIILLEKFKSNAAINYSIIGLGGVLVLVSLQVVTKRNPVWESQFSLYRNDIEHLDNSAKAHSLMATKYREVAMHNAQNFPVYLAYIDSSKYHFERALAIYPDYSNCLNNLGVLYHLNMQKTWQAIPLFKKAVVVKADYHQANHSLGTCYKKLIGASDYINNALQYIKLDTVSTAPFNSTIPQSVFESASYAKMIYEMIIKTLQTKGNAVIDVTAHQSIINEIKVSCNQFLILENSYLKSSFNFETELYQPLLKALSLFTPDSYQQTFDAIDKGINYKFGVFYANLITNQLHIKTYKDADVLFYALNDQRKVYVDSAVYYYQAALKIDSTNVIYYDDLIALLHNEKKEILFVETNEFAIANNALENKTQYYLNLVNYYLYKQNTNQAFVYLTSGIEHAKNVYTNVQNKEDLEAYIKQNELKSILQTLKLFYQTASQLHQQQGNVAEADKYAKLFESIN